MIRGIDPGAGASGSWKEARARLRRSRGSAALLAVALLPPGAASAATAAWTPAGPNSGSLRVLPAPSSPATIYAAPGSGGIWSSQDGGLTWSIASRLSATVTDLVAVDPVQATTVYGKSRAALFKSTDGAATWTLLTDAVTSFVIAPSAPRMMYSLVHDPTLIPPVAVLRSDDGGATWNQVGTIPASFNQNATFLAVSPADPSHVYVLGQGGFLASSDGGVSWGEAFSPLTISDVAIGLAVSPIAPQTLWIAIARPVAESGAIVYRSDDGGANWVEADAGLPPIADLVAAPSGTLYASAPLGSDLGVAIFSSADRGVSWQQVASGILDGGLTPASGTPDRLLLSDAGILISQDQGKSWSSPARPPSGAEVTQVSIGPAAGGNLLYVAETADGISSSGLWESANRGATWRALAPNGDFNPQLALDAQPGVLYAIPGSLALLPRMVSRDDGATWAPLPLPASPPGLLSLHFVAHALLPGKLAELDCVLVESSCVSYALELSNTGGRGWHRLGLIPPPVGSVNGTTLVRFAPGDPPTPYALLGDHLYTASLGSHRLTVLPIPPAPIQDLAIVPGPGAGPAAGPPTMFAACLDRRLVWKSVDGGRHWRAASIGLPQDTLPVALAVDPALPATLYLATTRQVFVSRNAAASWQPLATDGLPPAVPLSALAVAPGSPRLLVAGTQGAGIFTLPLP
jgi:photosystem II stability/assembly factor-like uncharacterized protein